MTRPKIHFKGDQGVTMRSSCRVINVRQLVNGAYNVDMPRSFILMHGSQGRCANAHSQPDNRADMGQCKPESLP